jgi:hypothetical protein
MKQIDVWNSASQMVRLYQAGAEMAAADRADEKLGQGDINGYEVWTRVVDAIRDLSGKTPRLSENLI